ncbi:MAG: flagellar hook-length control protein FliK [Spirochaetales bacterium]|nr:flagellar hook-length control protein FliK [Spirochaetales bacterium]
MTAVKGMDILPVRDKSPDAKADVKMKEEPSSFDKMMARKTSEEEKGPDRNMKPARAEDPVSSKAYSAKKIAALLKANGEEGSELKEISLNQASGLELINLPDETAVELSFPIPRDNEETLELISRFLDGEISSDDLDLLVSLDKDVTGGRDLLKLEGNLKELIAEVVEGNDEVQAEEGDLLKGILTEDGELVYFEEVSLDRENKISLKNSDSTLKAADTKNKATIEINVQDLRTAQNRSGEENRELASLQGKTEGEDFRNALENPGGDQTDLDLGDDLLAGPADRLISAEGAGGKLEAPVSREVSRMFQDYMNETGNKELVRKIDFILKNDNAGEIKLILKPEALGNVRINLSLNDNHLAGKIFVDNSSVRDIFLNNMDELTSILKENGYEEAALEVWVGQEGRDGSEREQQSEQGEDKSFRSVKGLERLEESVPHTAAAYSSDSGQVNLII